MRKDLLLHRPQLHRRLPRVTGKTAGRGGGDSARPIAIVALCAVVQGRQQRQVSRDRSLVSSTGLARVHRSGAPTETSHCQVDFDVQGLTWAPTGMREATVSGRSKQENSTLCRQIIVPRPSNIK